MASPSPTPPSLSPTPHPAHLHSQPQSKRDKRRNALSDRLNQITRSFNHPTNPKVRDQHFREQLASLQADMELIRQADVTGRNMQLLDDSTEVLQEQFVQTLNKMGIKNSDVNTDKLRPRWFADFVKDINDSMEERDTQMVLLYVSNFCPNTPTSVSASATHSDAFTESTPHESRFHRRASYSTTYPLSRRAQIARRDDTAASFTASERAVEEARCGEGVIVKFRERASVAVNWWRPQRYLRVESAAPSSLALQSDSWHRLAKTAWRRSV
jgi:hypothetical protein